MSVPGRDDLDPQAIEELVNALADENDILAYAYVLEAEAAERYAELADQMNLHNNGEVAEIFAKMANIENKHAEELASRSGKQGAPHHSPWSYRWLDPESPEVTPIEDVHYLMKPHQALRLALYNEQRALDFYELLVRHAKTEAVRELAREFAEEEREHVALVRAWIEKFPEPEIDWDEDYDSPAGQ